MFLRPRTLIKDSFIHLTSSRNIRVSYFLHYHKKKHVSPHNLGYKNGIPALYKHTHLVILNRFSKSITVVSICDLDLHT